MASCPNCGFDQPDDDYCANCGIDMSSYVSKRSLLDILKEPVAYVILLVLAVGISSSFIYSRVKDYILEQKSLELSGSQTYENLVEVSPPVIPTVANSFNEPSAELSSATTQMTVKEPEVFDSGKLNVYYASLSRTSPILANASMTNNVGTITDLSSYLTSEAEGSVNVVNMDSWSVPANAGRIVKIFSITKKLPESEASAGLNLRLEVAEISPESVTLTGGVTFVSVEAIPNVQNQPASNDAEDMGTASDAGEINAEDAITTEDEEINDPASAPQPSITFSTSTNSISSDQLNLNRGSALLISGIIPRRELSAIEADLMPNLIARFMLQREFLINNRDFVVFVEYSTL